MYENITKPELKALLEELHTVYEWLKRLPYSIQLHVEASHKYSGLGYPDLAIGAAYKALLLTDAVDDDTDEYHEEALADTTESFTQLPKGLVSTIQGPDVGPLRALSLSDTNSAAKFDHESSHVASDIVEWLRGALKPRLHFILVENLLHCGCYRSAIKQCQRGLQCNVDDTALLGLQQTILQSVRAHFERSGETPPEPLESDQEAWPDAGLVRRECYPWNQIEPDRFSQESLEFVNAEMAKCAPKLEVKAVDLPALMADSEEKISKQLGVFAKEDLNPGEIILNETSLLTANNRLQDPLCDACGVDIETGRSDSSAACEECYTVFCSDECLEAANESYHPAVCDKDVDSLARDVPPAQAADSLYLLLLLRSLAMAETQDTHPLNLKEVKFIWGDYHALPLSKHWQTPTSSNPFSSLPRTLPFNFSLSVELPFHILTKMDVNIFTTFRHYDVWIFNTLYAKFRGTASARFSKAAQATGGLKLGRKMQGPEVSAVHPCWCLANHSCDPNVGWEWGGKVQFKVRESRVEWKRQSQGKRETKVQNVPGIAKGEEIVNHYCDVGLEAGDRRAWAVGALGGDCRCERCVWEAGEE